MAVFAYIYHQSFVVPQNLSIEMILDQVCFSSSHEHAEKILMKYNSKCWLMFFCNGVDNIEPHIRGTASRVHKTWADHPG